MITIRINENGKEVIARKLAGVSALPKDMTDIFKRCRAHIQASWVRWFQKQGNGWARLAPRTVNDRENEGYDGDYPIGVRTGSMTDALTRDNVNTINKINKQSCEFGARSRAIASFHFGAPRNNQPARPIEAFDRETKDAVIYEIRRKVKNILRGGR